MAAPWEKYAKGAPQQAAGPWAKYSQSAPADFSGVDAAVSTTEQPVAADGRRYASYDGPMLEGVRPLTAGERAGYNETVNAVYSPEEAFAAELANKRQDFARMPAIQRAGIAAGSRVASMGRGLEQLVLGAQDALAPRQQTVGGLISGQPQSRYQEAMEREERARRNDQYMEGDTAATVGKFAGDVGMLAAPGGAVSKLATLPQRLAAGTALGASYGFARPVVEGESRSLNAAVDGAFGLGGEVIGQGARALGRAISPQAKAMFDAAKTKGIDLAPYQLTESPLLRRLGKLSENLPLTGSRAAARKQADQFTRAVSKTIGADAPEITPQVFFDASTKIGAQFDDLISRNKLDLTDDTLSALGNVQKEAAEIGDDGTIRAVNSFVDRILRQSKDGVLPGAAYQSIDSKLGKAIGLGGEKAVYLAELQEALREGMDRSVSAMDSEAWGTARRQWRDLKAIEPLVAKSESGTISPPSLMNRVTADRKGKAQMAKGTRGELGELARIGQRLKPPPSPGTAADLMSLSLINPLAYLRAGVGIPLGRALNSPLVARTMTSPTRPLLANSMARLAGPGGIATAPFAMPWWLDESNGAPPPK